MNVCIVSSIVGYPTPPNGNPGIVPPWLQQPDLPIPICPDPDTPVIMEMKKSEPAHTSS